MQNKKEIGYKVFNPDWTCRGFKYEEGKTYTLDGELKICENGFHFCKNLADCFKYYSKLRENKVAEIIAHGDVVRGDDKCCTNKIEILREIPWEEVLELANTGDWNTGDRNTGDRNPGNWNTGNWNTGDGNPGNWNTGDRNTGNRNTGDRNTGDRNTGNWNPGNWNTGDGNPGNWNTGDRNTGNWNICNYSSGFLCTKEPPLIIFDKEVVGMTRSKWFESESYCVLCKLSNKAMESICWNNMSDAEKKDHPEAKATGSYLKEKGLKKSAAEVWPALNEQEKQAVLATPNFDADIFYEIFGIRV